MSGGSININSIDSLEVHVFVRWWSGSMGHWGCNAFLVCTYGDCRAGHEWSDVCLGPVDVPVWWHNWTGV
jgi:hypothetical protein